MATHSWKSQFFARRAGTAQWQWPFFCVSFWFASGLTLLWSTAIRRPGLAAKACAMCAGSRLLKDWSIPWLSCGRLLRFELFCCRSLLSISLSMNVSLLPIRAPNSTRLFFWKHLNKSGIRFLIKQSSFEPGCILKYIVVRIQTHLRIEFTDAKMRKFKWFVSCHPCTWTNCIWNVISQATESLFFLRCCLQDSLFCHVIPHQRLMPYILPGWFPVWILPVWLPSLGTFVTRFCFFFCGPWNRVTATIGCTFGANNIHPPPLSQLPLSDTTWFTCLIIHT